jgi:hypothetical protein
MPTIRIVGKLCFALSVAALSSATRAADPLGLYFGAAAGQATIRADGTQFVDFGGGPLDGAVSISKNDTGWKAMLGVQPISFIGAEVEYIDFGHTSQTPLGFPNSRADLQARAPAAFAVLYAPIFVPAFDLYGKVGMASLHSVVNQMIPLPLGVACSPTVCPYGYADYNRERSDTRLAYGAGLQVKLPRFVIRAEYERISASTGDPSLMSLGLIWRFDYH